MSYHYHEIFSEVKEKIAAQYNLSDDAANTLYLNIIKNLAPNNDYTFQQIMLEYLTELQIKSLFFFHEDMVGHNGFYVKKQGDALIVTEVNDDNRLVVGDVITKMSNDEINILESRYKKLLFHEDDINQDWTHIIAKQSQLSISRGAEEYTFEVQHFNQFPENTVRRYDGYQVVTIYNFDEMVTYQHDLPVILDLRYARGLHTHQYAADIILISPLTKGSPEYFASQSNAMKIGENSFGAANIFNTIEFDEFVFVHGTDEEFVVQPDIHITNEAESDTILEEAKRIILS
ncbi:hypothetical protein ETI06_03200 [Macrococcoides goetzii]|nr:hypothetical protein [Macrococcus goetzii]TDM42150.1 hypothetical protein ETI10_03385 [Macrococcus goetzii]TDM47903.1 hypothetical protein ETI08_01850 [Macrococcus goetzii]TDM51005.1 hypothetical protein ETI06_03200 [Macrococcus goetzii]